MLADSLQTGRPRPRRLLRAALALLLGAAGVAAATQSAAAVDDPSTAQVAIIVPIVAPETSTGYLTLEEITRYTLPVGALTRQLDAVANRPVTLAVDPMIIASIRLLGTSAPASATDWLSRLASVSNDIIPLPYANSDLTLATQAGSPVLQPESFDFAIKPELFAAAVEQTPTPSPTPTADPDEIPALPTTESLLDWDYSIDDITWPKANSVISSDLDAINTAGFTTTILSSGNLTRENLNASVATIGDSKILVTDDALSAALDTAASALGPDSWQAAIGQVSASVSVGTGRTVIATLPRSVPAIGSFVADTLTAVATTPGVTLVPLSTAISSQATTATLVESPQDAGRVATVSRLLQDTAAEEQFSSILATPEILTADRRLDLLGLTSIGWEASPERWTEATSTFTSDSLEIRSSVQVVQSSPLNFWANNAPAPISVSNELPYPVTVYITMRPRTALVAVQNPRVELVIEPNSQAKGEVPIEAITNGIVKVEVSLTSATGVPIGSPSLREINVQAGWETPIVVVLAALVVLIFVIGIIRTVRRSRRAAAEDAPPEADAAPETVDADAARE
ncbi:MAG: DUF6049 family protein [Rhodoglobus sp.]